MSSEFHLDMAGRVTPRNEFGPRVAIGARALVSIDVPGPVSMSIVRGDGELIEAFTFWVKTVWFGPLTGKRTITVAGQDMTIPGAAALSLKTFTPITYRLVITSPGAELTIYQANISTSPYATPANWP